MIEKCVIDASVTGYWLFVDEKSDMADLFFEKVFNGVVSLVLPDLWGYDVVNMIRSAELSGRINAEEASRLVHIIEEVPAEFVPARRQGAQQILQTAFAHKLSCYDAAYVNLAETRGLMLYSEDKDILKLGRQFAWIGKLGK